MASIQELREVRLQKLEQLKQKGIDPYPAESFRSHIVKDAIENFGSLSENKTKISLAGRIRSIRTHGAIAFMNLEDESGRLQLFFKKDILGEENYKNLELLDMGDFLEAKGKLFLTKKEEKTLEVSAWKILTKSIRPIPEDWFGLKDEEQRLRKRYLDLLANPETRELFAKRAEFIKNIRDFLNANKFMEVEMPILENIPGGADAEPFKTHHNTLDIDLYLRISSELHLKRLMVGGFEKIYEIGKEFRNEGMSPQHLQEFTMLEFYWAYADYKKMMDFVENFYKEIIQKTFGTLEIKYKNQVLDFKKPWAKVDYREIVLEKSGIDIDKNPDKKSMQKALKEKGIEFNKSDGRGRLIDIMYKRLVRPQIIQPTFLINHPIDISPLAKKKEDDGRKAQRFQILIAGAEIGNAFSELNDPVDQAERFSEQMKLREAGDKEAQLYDEDYVEALEYGMPSTAGFGVGVDRLFMILANQESIRDVVFFPTMKPLNKMQETRDKKQK